MSEQSEITPGSVMYLRSGGPPMAVREVSSSGGLVYCQWFDDEGKVQQYTFIREVLTERPPWFSPPAPSSGPDDRPGA